MSTTLLVVFAFMLQNREKIVQPKAVGISVHKSGKDGVKIRDEVFGPTMVLPPDWEVSNVRRWLDKDWEATTIWFWDPKGQAAKVGVYYRMNSRPEKLSEEEFRQKAEIEIKQTLRQRSYSWQDYRIPPESCKAGTLGESRTMTCVGYFEEGRKAEHLVWVYGENAFAFFFSRVEARSLHKFVARFRTTIESLSLTVKCKLPCN